LKREGRPAKGPVQSRLPGLEDREANQSGGNSMIRMEDPEPGQDKKAMLAFADSREIGANIKVVGVGGGGGNAVNRMIDNNLQGVEFIAANTDCQALRSSKASVRLQIGSKLTKGLGAGANPDVGRNAALEDSEKILELLTGADMVFITAGLGGGTGTGATPIIANLAQELGALVVAVVTKPFAFEGKRRKEQAEQGLRELQECVDTVIAIPNEKLLATVDKKMSLGAAFQYADDILRQAVQGISDLITIPGEINLDFADVKTIMAGMGMALMGTGIARGENRAMEAAQKAISSPLLEDAAIDGAKGILINITGGSDMTLHEVSEASTLVQKTADTEANIIFGTVIDPTMTDEMKVTVIATGFKDPSATVVSRGRNDMFASRERSGFDPRISDTPAFLRKQQRESAGGFQPSEESPAPAYASLQDELDIPTFLRKQMD
jgi:cell division protein FtsZ